jgi:A/G-specific adenine glycosylase
MPWRIVGVDGTIDPYAVMVSEIMLQQTQVGRVIPKFEAFMRQFPTVKALADAPLSQVLTLWSGLGYNRRAKFLHQAAQKIMQEYGGQLPMTVDALVTLPGIGKNTAGAILAYAYNQPVLFIETNVRTVYIHHFFHDQTDIPDAAVTGVLDMTLDRDHPREFYWSLMDYGTVLKKEYGNLSRKSQAYAKQSKFEGSKRQVRGQVLRNLATAQQTKAQLEEAITDKRLDEVLESLQIEGLITKEKDHYLLG